MRRLLLEDLLLIAALQTSLDGDWRHALQEEVREEVDGIVKRNRLDWVPSKEEAS